MKRIIAGKTILLNTKTNCTFIASNLDEKVQTGSKENDLHIQWVGELDVEVVCKDDILEITQEELIKNAEIFALKNDWPEESFYSEIKQWFIAGGNDLLSYKINKEGLFSKEQLEMAIEFGINIEAGNIKRDYQKYSTSTDQFLETIK